MSGGEENPLHGASQHHAAGRFSMPVAFWTAYAIAPELLHITVFDGIDRIVPVVVGVDVGELGHGDTDILDLTAEIAPFHNQLGAWLGKLEVDCAWRDGLMIPGAVDRGG